MLPSKAIFQWAANAEDPMLEERNAKHFKSRRLGKHQPQEDFRSIFLESNDWTMPHALAISSCYFGWWLMPFRTI
jgi:hypothetical protein